MRFPLALAILLSIALGCSERIDQFLTLSRIFFFFSFFLLGYLLKDKVNFKILPWQKVLSLVLLFVISVGVVYFDSAEQRWMLGRYPYAQLGAKNMEGAIIRLGLYLLSAIIGFCFFALISQKENWLSKRGQASMCPYLLHGAFVFLLLQTSIYQSQYFYWQLVFLPCSFVCSVILTSQIIIKCTRWMVAPNWSVVFKWHNWQQCKVL